MTTTSDSPPDSQSLILKSDARGRVLTPANRREALLEEFERSGLSGIKFAALSGLKYSTFANWVQARKRQRGLAQPQPKSPPKGTPVAWLEAVVHPLPSAGAGRAGSLVLHLPGGARVEIAAVDHIPLAAALVRALEKPC